MALPRGNVSMCSYSVFRVICCVNESPIFYISGILYLFRFYRLIASFIRLFLKKKSRLVSLNKNIPLLYLSSYFFETLHKLKLWNIYCTYLLQDHKLKHMADLQQSVVSDPDMKQQISGQIVQWEENLERLHCEQFRLRCYMASLQSGELPNPKVIIIFSCICLHVFLFPEKQI